MTEKWFGGQLVLGMGTRTPKVGAAQGVGVACVEHCGLLRRREKRRIGRQGDRETEKKKGTRRQRGHKHLCSCANHSEDHNRLPVPRTKPALSKRLQVQHPQKTCSTVGLFCPCFETGRLRPEKTLACELVHHFQCSKCRLWRSVTKRLGAPADV